MNSFRTLLVTLPFVLVGANRLAAQDDPAPDVPSTTEAAPHLWMQRHQMLCDMPDKGSIELMFLGDSITQGWERDGVELWTEYYGDRHAANFGADQDLTQNVLWRIQNGALEGASPKVVVLQVGINNLLMNNTPRQVANGIGAVVGQLRERLPESQILVLGLLPVGFRPNPFREKVAKVNEFAAELAADDKVRFLDFGAKFVGSDGMIGPDMMLTDEIHPSAEGYVVWARELEPMLAEMLGVEPKKPAGNLDDPSLGVANDPAMTGIANFIADKSISLETTQKTRLPKPPKVKFNQAMDYFWVIETNHGVVEVKLMPDVAPMHCSSTLYLTQLGFYNDLIFHRVIPGFMAQGGCPLGAGTGGPGYKYGGEYDPKVKHNRGGLLSMANAGPGTDGSQFFLTFVATPWLDGKHTIFGEVVKGMEVLKEMEKRGTQSGRTTEKVTMDKCTIRVQPKG